MPFTVTTHACIIRTLRLTHTCTMCTTPENTVFCFQFHQWHTSLKKNKKICHLFIIKHHSCIIKQLWSIYRWVHQFHKWKTLMHGKMQCLRKVVYFWYTYQYILFINLSWQNTWGFCYSYIYKQFLHWPMHHHKVHIFTNGSLSLWEGLKQMSEIKLKK